MPDFNDYVEATAPIKFSLNGYEFNGIVRLNAMNPALYKSMENLDFGMLRLLEKIYVSLDLKENGNDIPITLENLKRFPSPLILAMKDEFDRQHKDLKKQ